MKKNERISSTRNPQKSTQRVRFPKKYHHPRQKKPVMNLLSLQCTDLSLGHQRGRVCAFCCSVHFSASVFVLWLTMFYVNTGPPAPMGMRCQHFAETKEPAVVEMTLPMSLLTFWRVFMADDRSEVAWNAFHREIGYSDNKISQWKVSSERCCCSRQLSFIVPLTHPLGTEERFPA